VVIRCKARPGTKNARARRLFEALDGLPELHGQREGQNDDGRRRIDGRRERPNALEHDRAREDKRCEVRPAPGGEARRPRTAAPGLGEAAFLGRGDRAKLGSMQTRARGR
jgi:hypothetical protein